MEKRWKAWQDNEIQLDLQCPMDLKISKYDEKRLLAEIMEIKNRRQEQFKALETAKKELAKYDDTTKAEKGQGKHKLYCQRHYTAVWGFRRLLQL